MSWNNYPENWETESIEIKILPEDHTPKKLIVGDKYHVSWANNNAMVWILKGYDEIYAFLQTPKSKKDLTVKITDLRDLNKKVRQNAKLRIYNYGKSKTRI